MGRAFEYRKARKLKRWGHMARVFTKIGKEIEIAVKAGGSDPSGNTRLTHIKNLMFISLAINPTTYIVIFLLLGVVLKSKRWKRLCLTLSALLYYHYANDTFSH